MQERYSPFDIPGQMSGKEIIAREEPQNSLLALGVVLSKWITNNQALSYLRGACYLTGKVTELDHN